MHASECVARTLCVVPLIGGSLALLLLPVVWTRLRLTVLAGPHVSVCTHGDRMWGAHHIVCVPGMLDKLPLCEFMCPILYTEWVFAT